MIVALQLKAKTAKILIQDIVFFPSNPPASEMEKAKYAAKVDSIIYAMVEIQIDIAFATSIVSQFTKNPSSEHFNAINQIL